MPPKTDRCPTCGGEGAAASPGANSTRVEERPAAPEVLVTGARPGTALPPMRLAAGSLISVYRIESVIGEGGMGVVYRAWDEAVGRPVAIKCLHTNLSGDAEIRRRFAREASVLRKYEHPHVVRVFDFVEHGYLLGIVMELVEGPTLVQYAAQWRGRMPFRQIAQLFSGVLEAVEAGHRQGIVHRDLKPDNILVVGQGESQRPKVVDFGIAKILEGTTYTVSNAFLGTCCYMAPEQVRQSSEANHLSDVYSLGVTLYQLCTGRLPFEGNHFQVMMAQVNEPPPDPMQRREGLPPALGALILKTLDKDPRKRPQSCRAFRKALQAALPSRDWPAPSSPNVVLPALLRGNDGSEMVLVPGGVFPMGRDKREVHVDAYYLDVTPVTNRQFLHFVEVTGYRPVDPQARRFLSHLDRGRLRPGREDHPVVFVSWHDARAYSDWVGKRLPTEAEWEKAARGVSGRKYPWGRREPSAQHANFGSPRGSTAPVRARPEGVSPYGVFDLAGNVWEWCSDSDDPDFYASGPSNNPHNTGAAAAAKRVMRGGSYLYGARSLRAYARTSFDSDYRLADGGFRCARSPDS